MTPSVVHQGPGCQVRPDQMALVATNGSGLMRGPSGAKIIVGQVACWSGACAYGAQPGSPVVANAPQAVCRASDRSEPPCQMPTASPPWAAISWGAYCLKAGSGSSSRPEYGPS